MNRVIAGVARQVCRGGASHNKQLILNGNGRCLLNARPAHAGYLVPTRQNSSGSGSDQQSKEKDSPDGLTALLYYSAFIFGGGGILFGGGDDVEKPDPSLPDTVPYLIIGSGTTALNAAYGVRLQDPSAKVLILSDSDSLPYREGALFRELWLADDEDAQKFEWFSHRHRGKRYTKSIFYEKDNYYLDPEALTDSEHGGVALAKNRKVRNIDTKKQVVVQENGKSVKYEKLLLVSDSQSPRNPVLDKLGDRVTYYEGVTDFLKLKNMARKGARIIVLGNTQQACDLATGMAACNRDSTQVGIIIEEKYLLGDTFPEHFAKVATRDFSDSTEIDVIPNASVQKADASFMQHGDVKLTLSTGEEIYCDHVVVASGSGANTSLGEKAGIRLNDQFGACSVNDKFEAAPNLWMAGDGVAFMDPSLGMRRVASTDQRVNSARLAGSNMAGAKKTFQRQPTRQGDLGPNSFYVSLGNCSPKFSTITYFPKEDEDGTKVYEYHGPGIVFYTKGGLVQGIMIWNMLGWRGMDGVDFARKILKSNLNAEDIDEVVKDVRLNTWDEFYEKMTKLYAEREKQEQEIEEMGLEEEK